MAHTGVVETSTGPTPDKPRLTAHAIAPWARWLSGVVGAAGLVAGGSATFEAEGEAGAVGLLAVGALFLVVAMAGALPSRVSFGGNEAEWGAVQEYVTTTVQTAPLEQRPVLLASLRTLARAAPLAAGPALESLAFDAVVREMIREIAHDTRPAITTESAHQPDSGRNLVIHGNDRRVIVEILYSGQRPENYAKAYARHSDFLRHEPDASLMIVVPWPMTFSTMEFMNNHDRVQVVPAIESDAGSIESLRTAILELLELPVA